MVTIFVTEDFSKSKQVKLDYNGNNSADVEKIMKLNLIKKFKTGIYDYSVLKSVFTPVNLNNYSPSLKISTSVQEWCGHTFSQLNLKKNKYIYALNSYFEAEGDAIYEINKSYLEDELWTLIRLNYKNLPTGKFKIIPNTVNDRFLHIKPASHSATAQITAPNNDELCYSLNIDGFRKLDIYFDKKFPHIINKWKETIESGNKKHETIALRKRTIKTAYWNQNRINDLPEREKLELTY